MHIYIHTYAYVCGLYDIHTMTMENIKKEVSTGYHRKWKIRETKTCFHWRYQSRSSCCLHSLQILIQIALQVHINEHVNVKKSLWNRSLCFPFGQAFGQEWRGLEIDFCSRDITDKPLGTHFPFCKWKEKIMSQRDVLFAITFLNWF